MAEFRICYLALDIIIQYGHNKRYLQTALRLAYRLRRRGQYANRSGQVNSLTEETEESQWESIG